jgi:hypothetical protein
VNGISWGTYQDQMCNLALDEWHCNAHANNFVIVPDATNYLSFLDLDMAFHNKSFVNFQTGKLGMSDDEWKSLKHREMCNLIEVLVCLKQSWEDFF